MESFSGEYTEVLGGWQDREDMEKILKHSKLIHVMAMFFSKMA